VTPLSLAVLLLAAPPGLPAGCVARLGETRFRHPGPVESLVYAPDGKTLVTHTPAERTARVWDAATGELVGTVAEPRYTRDVRRVVGFTPDGTRLVVENDDDEAVTINVRTGKEVSRWSMRFVTAVSPDGRHAVGVDLRGRATVWPLDGGPAVLAVGRVSNRSHFAAAFSPDGGRVAVTGHIDTGAGEIHLVNGAGPPQRLKPLGRGYMLVADWGRGESATRQFTILMRSQVPVGFPPPERPERPWKITAFAVSLDSQRMYIAEGGRIYASDGSGLGTIRGFADIPAEGVTHMTVSPDGTTLAVAHGGMIRQYDAATGRPAGATTDSQPPADRLALSRDGSRLLAVSDGEARLWDVPAGRQLHHWPAAGGPFRDAAVSPDGRFAAAYRVGTPAVVAWATDDGRAVFPGPGESFGAGSLLGFDAAGRLWLTDAGGVRAVELPDGRTVQRGEGGGYGAVTPDGRTVMTFDRRTIVVRPAAGERFAVDRRFSFSEGPYSSHPALSPTGRLLAAGEGQNLLVWDRRLGSARPQVYAGVLPRATDVFARLRFTPDGRQLAWSRAGDRLVRFWDAGVWAERMRFEPPGGVRTFDLSADGRRLAVAHPDGTVTVWDLAAVEAAAFAGDDRRPDDRLWDSLASPDPAVGWAAVRGLAARPATTPGLLAARLPVPAPGTVERCVADLDSPSFAVRDRATRTLAVLGEAAEGAVRRAFGTSPSAEVRRRAEQVLGQYQSRDGRLPPVLLRSFRAVEALERLGTPEAAAVLAKWAAGEPSALRTAEAKAALERMGK
jgi:WD40 repeat protein